MQERMATEVVRKNNLLKKVWEKLSGSEKMLMKRYGFERWQSKFTSFCVVCGPATYVRWIITTVTVFVVQKM